MKRKTHEEYVAELEEINPAIEVIGQYKTANNPLEFRCRVCGHEWTVPAYNLLRGTGCPACNVARKRKSLEQFRQEVAEINSNVEIIGMYVNTHTPIACRCRTCGYEWMPHPTALLAGSGCPRCAGNAPREKTD